MLVFLLIFKLNKPEENNLDFQVVELQLFDSN